MRALCVGLATLDVIHRVERPPRPNEKVVALDAELAPGGPATGAAITFAALGGEVRLLTTIGAGPLANWVGEALRDAGVDVHDADPDGAAPPVSAVTVHAGTGDRNVVSRNTVGREVSAPESLRRLVTGVDVVVIDGHHPRLALAAAIAAHERRVPMLLDAGSWKPVFDRLLGMGPSVVASADFVLPHGDDVVAGLIARGARAAAVTHGPSPVEWGEPGRRGRVRPPIATQVCDTLGAGDVFHGACAFGLADGSPFALALDFAAQVAAVRIEHAGPRRWRGDPRVRELSARLVAGGWR